MLLLQGTQHSHGSQPSETPVPEYTIPPTGLQRHQAHMWYTCKHASKSFFFNACNPSLGKQSQADCWVHWQASLTYLINSKTLRNPISRIIIEEEGGEPWGDDMDSTGTVQTCPYMNTHTHTYKSGSGKCPDST